MHALLKHCRAFLDPLGLQPPAVKKAAGWGKEQLADPAPSIPSQTSLQFEGGVGSGFGQKKLLADSQLTTMQEHLPREGGMPSTFKKLGLIRGHNPKIEWLYRANLLSGV